MVTQSQNIDSYIPFDSSPPFTSFLTSFKAESITTQMSMSQTDRQTHRHEDIHPVHHITALV